MPTAPHEIPIPAAEVIALRTLRPLDYDTVIASVMKTNRCVTVEEGWPVASIGNHISATLMQRAFDYLDAPVINCTGKDVPMPYAANLEQLALPTSAGLWTVAQSGGTTCVRCGPDDGFSATAPLALAQLETRLQDAARRPSVILRLGDGPKGLDALADAHGIPVVTDPGAVAKAGGIAAGVGSILAELDRESVEGRFV